MNYFQKVNFYKRGVSIIEIMITVAIVGILGAVSFPAYKSYRDRSKKMVYKTDLADLHRAWQNWSSDSGNFCKRNRTPKDVSIENVGMGSLYTNGRYGHDNPAVPGRCERDTFSWISCSGRSENRCRIHSSCRWVPAREKGNGPGKANFIGFGSEFCSNSVELENVILTDKGKELSNKISSQGFCDLRKNSYDMGVVGFLSGNDFFGQSINNAGVLSKEKASANPGCS